MAEYRRSGKLAVILHADVAGSTELVQQDEHLAHERIRIAFGRFAEIVARYNGRVCELRGDALLAEFERASDAVMAGLAFQSEQINHNRQLDDSIQVSVRVGIAMGEVVIADDTVTGAGVVLAQRLEQLAEPGGLVIQGAAYETVPRRLPFDYENLGDYRPKGFDESVRAYRVKLRPGEPIPPPQERNYSAATSKIGLFLTAVAVALIAAVGLAFLFNNWIPQKEVVSVESTGLPSEKPSIAVLPFTNMSGDPDQDYFADGMTDDLITDISKISGLFVVSRNSSFAYKGQSPDVGQVSKELSVRYVLEGSVRRAGGQVRINAQLIDATTGGHIWAERFDGNMEEVFNIQDEVNRKIVSALAVSLTQNDRERLEHKRTTSPDAYDMLLRGLELYQRFSPKNNAQAREFFKKAAALDPGYARAYANLSWSHTTDVNMNWTELRDESIILGEEYAKQALALDDSIPQIHMSLSAVYLAQRKHDSAVAEARLTLELHPNYADGYAWLAFVSLYAGELDEALASIHAAKRFNPRYSYIYLFLEGHIYLLMGQYQQAITQLQKAAERNPAFDRVHLLLAAAYGHLSMIEDAEWSVTEALVINPDISIANEQQNANYRLTEHRNLYLDGLQKAGLK